MPENYTFDTVISLEVLENYLSRSATAAGLYESDTLEDDLRAIRQLGIKFLGRASGVWYMEQNDEEHFALSRALADRVHAMDPEIILQACVFEWVVKKMEEVEIPAWVFEAFDRKPERRCFRLEDALFQEKPAGYRNLRDDPRKSGGIPDISRREAQMWFYYRAVRYIDCGYEALHMGQVHLYTAKDPSLSATSALFEKIREYARLHARRHKVLLDAHTHGINIRGKLLFDYHAMPFTCKPLPEIPGERVVLVREGCSAGGENPNGWSALAMPYLLEYDNWGGRTVENREALSREELARKDWWGYDQIGWFANQSPDVRRHFLEYTSRWVQINNPHAFFEAPFRRMLSDAAVTMTRADDGREDTQHFYQANRPGPDCPLGFGDEDVLRKILAEGNALRREAANPECLLCYGAQEEYEPRTGRKLPEKVVVYGSFQPYVGAQLNDSNSEVTRMYYIGEGTYALTVVLPFAGTFDFSVSVGGTLSETYQLDGWPRSGSSNKAVFTAKTENAAVRFTYRFPSGKVEARVYETERSESA